MPATVTERLGRGRELPAVEWASMAAGMLEGVLRARVKVFGRVQGVWFRETARREAERLGLAGWVRNCEDGTVEAVFEGEDHAVAQAVSWCRLGPPRAEVTGIEVAEEPPQGVRSFTVRR
jgi:acylphosphatase